MSAPAPVATTSPVNPMVSPIYAASGASSPVIGGTSGAAPGGGALSLNLGGVNLNYDLGPSVSAMAQQSNNFLSANFNADSALLGQTILGSNNLLSSIFSPIVASATQTQAQNNQVLPGLYNQLLGNNFQIGMAGLNAQSNIAQASIASSNASAAAAANSGGGCYITTAVCESENLPDDCEILRKLRKFRDGYMLASRSGRDLVRRYYATAPRLVAVINSSKNAAFHYKRMLRDFILPACEAIDANDNARAQSLYISLVEYAELVAADILTDYNHV